MVKYTILYTGGRGGNMSYKVIISDDIVLEECVQDIKFNVDTIDFNAMRTDTTNSMIIRGKIDTDEGTVKLYKWAMIPGTDSECYKGIMVEIIKDNQIMRKVNFSKAFVVDYSEDYSNHVGVGTFTLYVKQFIGKDIECVDKTAKASFEKESSIEEFEEAVEEVEKLSHVIEKSTKRKSVMSITDRIAKQKKMEDNSSTRVSEVVKNGTQSTAEELYNRSKELQALRNDWDKRNGTTAVMRAIDNETNEEVLLVATNSPRKAIIPEFEGKLKENEIYVGGEGHAEQTIIENSGDRYTFIEGGSSRNVCKGICQPLIEGKDMKLGGPEFKGRDDKSKYRQFWKD